MARKKTRQIFLGGVSIGGDAPVRIQSMTNTDTRDVEATLGQIEELHKAGCEMVRVAVPDDAALRAFRKILESSPLPVIADIHFDWRLALGACEAGASGIRINPGNIGSKEKIDKIIDVAKDSGTVIRIGVNSGSLEKDLLGRYGRPSAQALAESALRHVGHFLERDFTNLKISIKSSSALATVEACRLLAGKCDFPQHIGITEAGPPAVGAVRSAVGLGILLNEGIGDTLRVSLTANPVEEIRVAKEILRSFYPDKYGPELISCPTCGRTEIDLQALANVVEKRLATINIPIRVAVMGCVVNGPGEAREADIGIAGGRDKGIIFRKGKVTRSVRGKDNLAGAFMEELDKIVAEYTQS